MTHPCFSHREKALDLSEFLVLAENLTPLPEIGKVQYFVHKQGLAKI